MNPTMIKLSIVSALLIQVAALQAAFAAPSSSAGLFQLNEVPGLSSGASVQLAAKCGAGSCGGKEQKKDGEHKCGKKDGEHKCGKKDGDHKCGKKDAKHSCGTKEGAHTCGAKTTAPAHN